MESSSSLAYPICTVAFSASGCDMEAPLVSRWPMLSRRSLLSVLSFSFAYPSMGSSLSGYAAAKNPGQRLGINLSGMSYWAAEQPFTNLACNAARWRVQVKDAPFTWDEELPPMTLEGYPLTVPTDAWLDSFLIFTPHRRHLPSKLFLHYEGSGRMTYVGGGELIERLPGRDLVRNLRRDDALTLRLIETSMADPVRNIRLSEQDPPSNEIFRGAFLKRLENMSALRFMDWMATNNSPVKRWDERPQLGRFAQWERGVPLENMVHLSNTTGIPPWFTMPHQADDDYIRKFAQQVRRDLDPSLAVHVEYSNEVWNLIFDQADYAGKQGLRLGFSSDGFEAQLRYYSYRTTQIIKLWREVFAEDASRIVGVFAAQASNPWTSETILGFQEASQFADVLAIAPYFGGGLGDPMRAKEVEAWDLDQLFSQLNREVETDTQQQINAQMAVARRYNVALHAYEGGQHLVGYDGAEDNEQLTELFIAANRDPRMGQLYQRHLAIWHQEGGGLYALFASMGEPSKWGSWGLLEFEGDRRPKWDAVQRLLRS
ncbi:MAG: hypothetical protein ACK4QP_01180 [Pseudorhizobium sp.]